MYGISVEKEVKEGNGGKTLYNVTGSSSKNKQEQYGASSKYIPHLPRRCEEPDTSLHITRKCSTNKEMGRRFLYSPNSDLMRKRELSEMSYSKTCGKEKEKPDFELSGKLHGIKAQARSLSVKYLEPTEARKPNRRWRLYPFKGEVALPTLYIHRQSCYLVGRDRKLCDVPVDHPSCSKQHAAIQYRMVARRRENGSIDKCVCPYLIDLESANGTFINNIQIETKKYVELFETDVIKFGFSSREYVLLHENSDESQLVGNKMNFLTSLD